MGDVYKENFYTDEMIATMVEWQMLIALLNAKKNWIVELILRIFLEE